MVCLALPSGEQNAASISKSVSRMWSPAARACSRPFSLSRESILPCQMPCLLRVVSPCLMK